MSREPSVDRVIVALAGAQDGVFTRAQLRARGVSDETVDRRLRSGLLVARHRGVLSFGGVPLSERGRRRAALLAAGPDAVLSHGSSGVHWGVLAPRGGPVHVTVPARRRSRDGLVVHVVSLPERSTTLRAGLRCTTVARTMLDIAARHGPVAATRAWTTAASRRLIRPADVAFELERSAGRPGARTVAALGASHDEYRASRVRSSLELRALRMLRDAGVPPPASNRLVVIDDRIMEGDLIWGDERIAIEVDGRGGHDHGVAFDDDRERDALFGLAGWRTARWTERDVEDRPGQTIARIRAMLAQEPLRPAPDGPTCRIASRAAPR